MNISDAALQTGMNAKTIRYYESIGLLPPPPRKGSGYRDYGPREIETLRFVGRARSLGFSIEDIAALLALYADRTRPSVEVKHIAESAMSRIEAKINELSAMHRTLGHLVHRCHGDNRPDCPILDDLSAATHSAEPASPPGPR